MPYELKPAARHWHVLSAARMIETLSRREGLDRLSALSEEDCRQLVGRLQVEGGGLTPAIWDIRLNASEAPAIWQALMHDRVIRLGDVLPDSTDREQRLPVVPLLIERGETHFLMPADDFRLQAGDQLLLASPLSTQRRLQLTLQNANELDYVLTGRENSGSLLSKLLASR